MCSSLNFVAFEEPSECQQFSENANFSKKILHRKHFNFGSQNYVTNTCSNFAKIPPSPGNHQRAYEIVSTIVNVLKKCGINKIKAYTAFDYILYSYIRFIKDEKGNYKIRKAKLIDDLRQKCGMRAYEVKMVWGLVKAGFTCLLQSEVISQYDAQMVEERVWDKAIKKTIELHLNTGTPTPDVEGTMDMLSQAYKGYMRRRNAKECDLEGKSQDCSSFLKPRHRVKENPSEKKALDSFFTCPQLCSGVDGNPMPMNFHVCNHKRKGCMLVTPTKPSPIKSVCVQDRKYENYKKTDIVFTLRSKRIECQRISDILDPGSCICDRDDSFSTCSSCSKSTLSSTDSCGF